MTRSLTKMLTAFNTWFDQHSTKEEKKADLIGKTVGHRLGKWVMSRRQDWLDKLGATKLTDAEAYTVAVEWQFEREPTGFNVTLTVGGAVKLWSIGSTLTTREEAEEHERGIAPASHDGIAGFVSKLSIDCLDESELVNGEELADHVSEDLKAQILKIEGSRKLKWWTFLDRI